MIKTLLKSVGEYKRPSFLAPIMVTIEVIFEVLIPFNIARLVNLLEQGATMQELIRIGLLILAMTLLSLVFGALSGNFAAEAATGFGKNLRRDMFTNVQNFSFGNINKFTSSSLVTRLTTDVSNVQMAYMMFIRAAFRFPVLLIFSAVMASVLAGRMALVFLLAAPILAITLVLIMRAVIPRFKKVFRRYDRLNNTIQENIKGIRVVKAYVQEAFERERFEQETEGLRKEFTAAERIIALNSPIFEQSINIVLFFVMTVGSYLVITSQGTTYHVGQMSAMTAYSFQIMNALMMLSMLFVMFTISQESARRIVEVLEEVPEMKDADQPIHDVKDGSIRFTNVDFSYDQYSKEPVEFETKHLDNINLYIESGQTVGIIGSTGSSKSTLVQMIPRLYDVQSGSVEVGGVDVRDYDIKSLRDNVSIVLQKNVLFSGTIAENLRWGDEHASDEDIMEVAKLAQAHDFIMDFENGYDTYIEQGGTNVSGGQRQRISIARSLLKKPKILIMDDSTSAVDTKTDARIRQGLKDYLPETTKIIIAQRIASIQDADIILLMDEGKIQAMGPHEELLKTSPIYEEIYSSQTKVGGLGE